MQRSKRTAGFILAGGQSSRMGRDKALLEIGGVPLLLRTARLLEPLVAGVTVIGSPERYAALRLRIIPDDAAELGPLGGIATALRVSTAEWNLIVGCDLPYLSPAWLSWLTARAEASRADAVLPEGPRGVEPLCAMYRTSTGAAVGAALAKGVRKVTDGLAGLVVENIPESEWKAFDPSGLLFTNMNSPEDYAEARARLQKQPAK